METALHLLLRYMKTPLLLITLILLGTVIHYLLFVIVSRIRTESDKKIGNVLVRYTRNAVRWVIILIILTISLSLFKQSPFIEGVLKKTLPSLLILSVSWLLIRLTYVVEYLILNQFNSDDKDNLKARRVYTQIIFLKKLVIISIGVFAAGIILMTFEQVRQIGTSILASAGIVGIVVGFAAQSTLRTLFAGFQIAFTQPIRLDDVVIVENEWGNIEEITLTYVVVRIWDMRRLILPITYFIEKPFQNWTRGSLDLLGTVFIYADYSVNVQKIREELERIVSQEEIWDGKVCELNVTNSTDRAIELRVLISASDSSKTWQLRCQVREKLIEYLQKTHPESLPKVRAEVYTEMQAAR